MREYAKHKPNEMMKKPSWPQIEIIVSDEEEAKAKADCGVEL